MSFAPLANEPRGGLDAATFEQFRALVYQQSGIALQANKESLVAARVAKRMRALGLPDYAAYLRHVQDDPSGEELVHLLDAISTNVTSFFREPAHFDLVTSLVQHWVDHGVTRLRFWSAACSTGEEPYTLAMVIDQALAGRTIDWKILATDLSTRVLQRAQAGVYDAERLTQVPVELRQRYFAPVAGAAVRQWQVARELRDKILFRRINLSTPPFPMKGSLDVVFCRNVMIYFDAPTRTRLVNEIHRLLKPGGHLCVGHAESLTGVATPLKSLRPSIYVRG